MNIQITDAGVAALTAGTGPIVLNLFKLGSDYGFTPSSTDTDIHGTLIYSGVPSAPIAVNGNLIKYSMLLDYNLGPFDFGNLGLFMTTGDLFAIGASSELIHKLILSSNDVGNTIRLDVYLSMVGTNYEMWMDLAETNNEFRLAVFESVDQIPPAKDATPNAYVITGASSSQSAFIAYTDRNALWNFDCYKFSTTMAGEVAITGFSSNSVTINLSDNTSDFDPSYFGERILEFTTGALYGICRYIKSVQLTSTTAILTFDTNLAMNPAVGDKFIIFSRDPLANSNITLPIASSTELGAIKIGSGLDIAVDGTTTVDSSSIPGGIVISVNNKQGNASLAASDIPGTVRSVNSTLPDSNGNVNTVNYTLPIASKTVLGGVKASSAAGTIVTINSQGVIDLSQTPVLSFNGNSGNVTVLGLINPVIFQTGADLNTFTSAGIFYANNDNLAATLLNAPSGLTTGVLEVVPLVSAGSGACIQRWTQNNVSYFREYNGTIWAGWQGNASSVTSVNGQSGVVTILGLITPTAISASSDLNTYKTSGLFFVSDDTTAAGLSNVPPNVKAGNLEVIPLTNNNSGALLQRWMQGDGLYYRHFDGTTWTPWQSAAGTILPATTSTIGGVIIGNGLDVDSLGTLSVNETGLVKTVNTQSPDGTGNVTITLAELGGLSTGQVGVQGGIAGSLDTDPTQPPADANVSNYTYGRLPNTQLPLGTFYYFGLWDANANVVTVNPTGPTTISFQNTGLMTYSFPDPENVGQFITYQVPANGKAFRISTVGATALDGISTWAVDDVILAIGNKWYKIPSDSALTQSDVETALGISSPTANEALIYDGTSYKTSSVSLSNSYISSLDPSKIGTGITLSNGNNTATFTSGQAVALGIDGSSSGKYYFEVTFTSGTASSNASVGLVPASEPLDSQVGYNDIAPTVGLFQNSGTIYTDGGTNSGTGTSFETAGNVVCVAYDATNRLVWFRVGNGNWNNSASNNPATGTGGITVTGTSEMYPAIGTDSASVWNTNFNFFSQAVPSGFSAWSANHPVDTLVLADSDVSNPQSGDILKFDGSKWGNTPAGDAIVDASETDKGIIRIATEAETEAFTDDTTAVSPLNLGKALATLKLTFVNGGTSYTVSSADNGKVIQMNGGTIDVTGIGTAERVDVLNIGTTNLTVTNGSDTLTVGPDSGVSAIGISSTQVIVMGASSTQGATEFTGQVIFDQGISESFLALTNGATVNIDCSKASYYSLTITQNTTFTVSGLTSGKVNSFVMELTNGGAFTVTLWSGIQWSGSNPPTLTTSGTDSLGFYTLDGTTWTGRVLALDKG